MKPKRIALLGECMVELNTAAEGLLTQTFGGDSLNSAIYLARAGGEQVKVAYVTALGTDHLSDAMLNAWQSEGINTEWVLRDPVRQPGLYLIQLDADGERSFMYWRNNSAARLLLQHADYPAVEEQLSQLDAVYLSGISLAILPAQDRARLISRLAELKQQGVDIIFDSNYRPALWASAEQARETYQQILRHTSLALVTDDDEAQLWGDTDVEATFSRLEQAGVDKAVIKCGAAGCQYRDFSVPGTPALFTTQAVEQVVDTTSAGDAFNAGYLAGYLLGKPPAQCAAQGNTLAGLVIQHQGAIIPRAVCDTVTTAFATQST